MSTETPNLHLVKPDSTDPASIAVINANMDKIDEWAGADPVNRAVPTLNGLGTWDITDVQSARINGVCSLTFSAKSSAAVASGNIGNQEVVVIPLGWRPEVQATWVAGDVGCMGRVLDTGQLNINNGGTGMPANTTIQISLTYVLAD